MSYITHCYTVILPVNRCVGWNANGVCGGQSESWVNYVGGIISEIFESERILNNDHTGVADDAGTVIWLGNLKKPYQSFQCFLPQIVMS